MKAGGSLSIWFFIGLSLLVNGLLILGAGIYQWSHPPQTPLTLYHLHAGVWWGALLTILGAMYCVHFAPHKAHSRKNSNG